MRSKSLLSELTIRNLGVIKSSEVEFKAGFTAITGETGAGKTMLLTALNLILGGKTDSDLVRNGSERLVVSGTFDLTEELSAELDEIGGFHENNQLVINRSVNSDGKSKISLGGASTTATAVSQFAENLIEIHAQASSARLTKNTVQRDLLDSFGNLADQVAQYADIYENLHLLQKRIIELKKQLIERDNELAGLEEFSSLIKKVSPKAGELMSVDKEISKLGSVEELNTILSLVLDSLNNEDSSLASTLSGARKNLESAKSLDEKLESFSDRFNTAAFEISEVVGDLERYLAKLEADPVRFDQLQERKKDLLNLVKKFGEIPDRNEALISIIAKAELASDKIRDLLGGGDRLTELEGQAAKLFFRLQESANKLSSSREFAALNLSKLITRELEQLALPKSRLEVNVVSAGSADFKNYGPSGLDTIEFLFASHSNGKLLPITKAASGGELSRVMLGVEVVLAASSPVGTYIFDEVDAGVGGKAAIEVGRRLATLALQSQVIVVTHLAQVASWADNHLVVTKSDGASITQSDVVEVFGDDRRREIARLLSGQENSQSAQEHAGELLELVSVARAEMIG